MGTLGRRKSPGQDVDTEEPESKREGRAYWEKVRSWESWALLWADAPWTLAGRASSGAIVDEEG